MKKQQQNQNKQDYQLPPDEEQDDEEIDPYSQLQQQMDQDGEEEEEDYGQQQLDVDMDDDEDGDEVVDQVAETIPRGGGGLSNPYQQNNGQPNMGGYYQQQQQQQQQQQLNGGIGNSQNGFGNLQLNQNLQYPAAGGQQQNRMSHLPLNQQQQQPQQMGVGGRMRQQSAKVNDNNQLKFQQQLQQNQVYGQMMQMQNPQWVGGGYMGGPQQQNYMSNDPNLAYQLQQQQQNLNPNTVGGGFITNGFYGGIPQSGNAKKRPTTASRKGGPGNAPMAFGMQKKSFPSKNPSTLDLEVSKLRPKIINQERERLYDDAIKQKMTANFLKDENMRLKTKMHKMEAELNQKEKLIDDLLQQQDSFQYNNMQEGGIRPPKSSKIKLEGHLAQNLKRKIRELQILLAQKHEEGEVLRRNIKSTKTAELEVEIKLFSDECVRLRHQLEEVIKSKDTFADPEELKIIEAKFAQQDQMIGQLRSENTELANAYSKKEDENRQLREMFADMEKKTKKAITHAKEQAKLKKTIKSQDKDLKRVQSELAAQKSLNDDYRAKIEEMVKKGPLNQSSQNQSYSHITSNKATAQSNAAGDAKLKHELQDKEQKVQELNNVIQQLQSKLQEKLNELGKEQNEKDKFKRLYEQYQDEVVQLQSQLEDAGIKAKVVKRQATATNSQPNNNNESKGVSASQRPKSAYRPGGGQNNTSQNQIANNQSIDSKNNKSKQNIVSKPNIKEDDDEDEENYSDDAEEKPKNTQQVQKNNNSANAAAPSSKGAAASGKMTSAVDQKKAKEVALELKLKLQSKGFFYHQINEFFFKPYQKDSLISQKQLIDMFETNGFNEKRSRLLARYIVEPKEQDKVLESDDNTCSQQDVVKTLSQLIGHFKLFNDANQVKRYTETIMKTFAKCKSTLKDALQMEDYEDDGTVPVTAFQEAFDNLDINLDKDTFDYLVFAVYQRSESMEKMNYQVLLDLIEGKVSQGGLSVGSTEGGARKRPESSSPEKLKARNKEKYNSATGGQSQGTEQSKKALVVKKVKNNEDGDEEDEDENYEEEFDKLLDKDDDEDQDSRKGAKVGVSQAVKKLNKHTEEDEEDEDYGEDPDFQGSKVKNPKDSLAESGAGGAGMDEMDEEDYIDEEQMLDVAEKCFMKIAEAIIQRGVSVRQAFKNFIIKEQIETEEGETQAIELLSPMAFLEGIKDIGVVDLEEVEVACLMRVLTKADLENAILLRELIVIMENFGIQDDDDDQSIQMLMGGNKIGGAADDAAADQYGSQELGDDMDGDTSQADLKSGADEEGKKKKKKKAAAKPLDLSGLDEKSIKIMAKLMLALMELNVSLYDFFAEVIYEQLVKSKKKQNNVQIINTKDFYTILMQRGVRKSDKDHENLTKFLQLDPNYPNLLMLKKITKTLDEMSQNEELMTGIMAAAQDDDDGQPHEMGDEDDNYDEDEMDQDALAQQQQQQPQQQQIRLNTIGEEDQDEFNTANARKNTQGAAAALNNNVKAIAAVEDNYDEEEEEYEENGADDYEF